MYSDKEAGIAADAGWKVWGHSLSPWPEPVRAEMKYLGYEAGEFRFNGPDKSGFYAIEVRGLVPAWGRKPAPANGDFNPPLGG